MVSFIAPQFHLFVVDPCRQTMRMCELVSVWTPGLSVSDDSGHVLLFFFLHRGR